MRNQKKTILVAGCGRFGASLAGTLSNHGYNVTIIDRDSGSFRRLPANFSGFEMRGDATDPDVLAETNIETAAMVVAATDNDNVNCMIAQIASRIYGVSEVFARLNDTDKEHLLIGTNIHAIYPFKLTMQEFRRLSTIDIGADEK